MLRRFVMLRRLLRLFRRSRPLPAPQPSAVRGHWYGDSAGAGRVRTP